MKLRISGFIAGSTMVAVVAAGGSVLALAGAVETMLYVLGAKAVTQLAHPPKVGKMAALGGMLLMTGAFLAAVSWRVSGEGSLHRTVASRWAPSSVALLSVIAAYFYLCYYPVPPHAHHIDKLLLCAGLVLVWSSAFLLRPMTMDALAGRRLWEWTRLVLINIVVFILAGELVLRLADPLLARSGLFGGTHTPAHLTPHRSVRGTIGHANSHGFRDKERRFERRSNVPRIVALGDSLTYGAGVQYDETFVALLEGGLQVRFPGAEVINLGVPGWELPQEFHLLKDYGVRFQPDLVLLNLFVGNDIEKRRGAFREEPFVVAGRSFYVHTTGNRWHDTLGQDRWFLYHNLNYLGTMLGLHIRRWIGDDEPRTDFEPPLRTRTGYLKELDERTDIYLKEYLADTQVSWDRAKKTLNEIREFLAQTDIRFLIVLIPDHIQVDQVLQSEYLRAIGVSRDRYDFRKPQRLLQEWCHSAAVPCANLLPVLTQDSEPARLYFLTDLHWTADGHRVAATYLTPLVSDELAGLIRTNSS